jgi:8-oxo-dGTP pyrophosphatase MutT (NUDIX family)
MAFPGGRLQPEDEHGFAAAVRETEEEVGLRLGPRDRVLGRLSELNAHSRRMGGLAITPFVFRLEREVQLHPNHEVAEVVWVPLEFLLDTDNRTQMRWQRAGVALDLPCYDYQGRRIWGLSLGMLDELMDLIEGRNPQRPRWRRF